MDRPLSPLLGYKLKKHTQKRKKSDLAVAHYLGQQVAEVTLRLGPK
jgi:hypothetical protein